MADMYAQLFIDRILELCNARGITVYQLSQMSGVSHSTLDNIVHHRTGNPRVKTLHKLALAFSMTLPEFLNFAALNEYSFDDDKEQEE